MSKDYFPQGMDWLLFPVAAVKLVYWVPDQMFDWFRGSDHEKWIVTNGSAGPMRMVGSVGLMNLNWRIARGKAALRCQPLPRSSRWQLCVCDAARPRPIGCRTGRCAGPQWWRLLAPAAPGERTHSRLHAPAFWHADCLMECHANDYLTPNLLSPFTHRGLGQCGHIDCSFAWHWLHRQRATGRTA